jgi:hypothetical protein
MPRYLLAAAALIGTTLLGAGSSQAQYNEGPWCAEVRTGRGSVKDICHFRDFESCRLEAVSGNRGFCKPNPRWAGVAQEWRLGKRKAKRKHRRS